MAADRTIYAQGAFATALRWLRAVPCLLADDLEAARDILDDPAPWVMITSSARLRTWRAELARLCLCALLGIVLNMWLYREGVSRTSALHTGLLVVQIPVFTYAVACLAGIERAQRRRVLGIAVALLGALVIVLERSPGNGSGGSTVGNVLIVANCLSYAVYLVLARGLLQRFPTLVVIAWVFWFSLPAVPLFFLDGPVWPVGAAPRVLASFAYTLVFGTFLAYLLNAFDVPLASRTASLGLLSSVGSSQTAQIVG